MSSKSMMTVAYCLWNSPETDLLRACCCRMSKVNRTHHHSLLHTVIPIANKINSTVQFRVSAHHSVIDGPNEFGRGAYLCKYPPLPSRPRSTWLHVCPGKRPPSACYSTYMYMYTKRGELIICQVRGRRWQSPLAQGGLEVPCELNRLRGTYVYKWPLFGQKIPSTHEYLLNSLQ